MAVYQLEGVSRRFHWGCGDHWGFLFLIVIFIRRLKPPDSFHTGLGNHGIVTGGSERCSRFLSASVLWLLWSANQIKTSSTSSRHQTEARIVLLALERLF